MISFSHIVLILNLFNLKSFYNGIEIQSNNGIVGLSKHNRNNNSENKQRVTINKPIYINN